MLGDRRKGVSGGGGALTCLVCPSQGVVRLAPGDGEETPLVGMEMMAVPVCPCHLQLDHSPVGEEGRGRWEGC